MKKNCKVSPRLSKIPSFNPFEVEVDIKADSVNFIPIVREDGGFDLVANSSNDVNNMKRHTITSRVIQKIDCGFSISMPKGYHLVIEGLEDHMSRGLVVFSGFSGVDNQRVCVYAHNLGKEIMIVNSGDKIARMYILASYNAKLNVKEKE